MTNFKSYYNTPVVSSQMLEEGIPFISRSEFHFNMDKNIILYKRYAPAKDKIDPRNVDYGSINEALHHAFDEKLEIQFGDKRGFKVIGLTTSDNYKKNKITDKYHSLGVPWNRVTSMTIYITEGLEGGKGKIIAFTVTDSKTMVSNFFIATDRNFVKTSNVISQGFFDALKKKAIEINKGKEEKEEAESNAKLDYKKINGSLYDMGIEFFENRESFFKTGEEQETSMELDFNEVPVDEQEDTLKAFDLNYKEKDIDSVFIIKTRGETNSKKYGSILFYSVEEKGNQNFYVALNKTFQTSYNWKLDDFVAQVINDIVTNKKEDAQQKANSQKIAQQKAAQSAANAQTNKNIYSMKQGNIASQLATASQSASAMTPQQQQSALQKENDARVAKLKELEKEMRQAKETETDIIKTLEDNKYNSVADIEKTILANRQKYATPVTPAAPTVAVQAPVAVKKPAKKATPTLTPVVKKKAFRKKPKSLAGISNDDTQAEIEDNELEQMKAPKVNAPKVSAPKWAGFQSAEEKIDAQDKEHRWAGFQSAEEKIDAQKKEQTAAERREKSLKMVGATSKKKVSTFKKKK